MATDQTDISKITLSFPQALAIITWDAKEGKLPPHTDGMVRIALQNRGILDESVQLTRFGADLRLEIECVVLAAAQTGGTTFIPVDASPLVKLACKALVTGMFGKWGDSKAGEGRALTVGPTAFAQFGCAVMAKVQPEPKGEDIAAEYLPAHDAGEEE